MSFDLVAPHYRWMEPLLAGRNIDSSFVLPAVAASVDLVVHCERDASGRRRVVEIVQPTGVDGGEIAAQTLYRETP